MKEFLQKNWRVGAIALIVTMLGMVAWCLCAWLGSEGLGSEGESRRRVRVG